MAMIQYVPEYVVTANKVEFFQNNGFVVCEDVVAQPELERYVGIVNDLLEGRIKCNDKRGDLGGHAERKDPKVENCVQITHPYILTSLLDECEHFRKGRDICNQLFGAHNFALDCSQILVKPAHSSTETPWHQDQAYYPSALPDTRAANVWLALEDCSIEMGCLAFHPVPLNCAELAPHRPAGNGKGALTCDPPAGQPVLVPVKAGSAVIFANHTYHFGGPNTSDRWRPAFVAQYRPAPMIQACRMLGFDHGKFVSNDGEERTAERLKLHDH